jgi:hypothetical protein
MRRDHRQRIRCGLSARDRVDRPCLRFDGDRHGLLAWTDRGRPSHPAVTVSIWVAGRMNARDAISYIVAQCLGAIRRRSHPGLDSQEQNPRLQRCGRTRADRLECLRRVGRNACGIGGDIFVHAGDPKRDKRRAPAWLVKSGAHTPKGRGAPPSAAHPYLRIAETGRHDAPAACVSMTVEPVEPVKPRAMMAVEMSVTAVVEAVAIPVPV